MSPSPLPETPERAHVDTAAYLGLSAPPQRLRDRLAIAVSAHAFLPRFDDLQADWVASVATPAFKLVRQRQGALAAFASIGTGTGLDALAAIETLGVARVGITDVHDDVVRAAAANIAGNLREPGAVAIESGYGDLLGPLLYLNTKYDLIYENLPNVPIDDAAQLATERLSSGHVPPRAEPVPDFVQRHLLTLHYLALRQSRGFLAPGGAVLSMLGGRIPLAVFHRMAEAAGFRSEIFTFSWKVQADAAAMVRGHAERQRAGYGPFHFYRVDRLAEVFADVDLAGSGARAHEIEAVLAPDRLDALQADAAVRRGEPIGHTAVVLRSQPI